MSVKIIVSVLTQIGVSENGAKLYEFLIQLKKPTVTDLSLKMGKTRKQIYELLQELENHNLLQDRSNYQRGIIASSPNYLMALIKNRDAQLVRDTSQLEKILPNLVKTFDSINQNPTVQTYTTLDEIRTLYLEIMNDARGEVLTFGNLDTFSDLIGESYLEYYIKLRKKNKVLARSLVFMSNIAKKYQSSDRDSHRIIRYLPKGDLRECSFGIHNNKVSIWNPIWPKVVVIEDELVAELFRLNFELLWEQAQA